MPTEINTQNNTDIPPEKRALTPELVLELWSRTYNREGKPDWSHIFPYYHPDIIFEDSIQKIEGITDFTAMCDCLAQRCEQLNMDILSIAGNDLEIFFLWKMTMMFRRFPSTPMYGSTYLRLDEAGMIIHQRDYYDIWGDIFNGIPGFRRLYRAFMHKYFG